MVVSVTRDTVSLLYIVSSEGAATANSVTTEDNSLSVRREFSREISEESETRLV